MNWKCRWLGHKLRPLRGGTAQTHYGPMEIVAVNMGACERCGEIYKIDPSSEACWEQRG